MKKKNQNIKSDVINIQKLISKLDEIMTLLKHQISDRESALRNIIKNQVQQLKPEKPDGALSNLLLILSEKSVRRFIFILLIILLTVAIIYISLSTYHNHLILEEIIRVYHEKDIPVIFEFGWSGVKLTPILPSGK